MYAFVQNGQVITSSPQVPTSWRFSDGRTTGNFDLLSPAEQIAEGWYPLVEVTPEYDQELQRPGGSLDDIQSAQVVRTVIIEDIPLADLQSARLLELQMLLAGKLSASLLTFNGAAFQFNEQLAANCAQLQTSLSVPGVTFPSPFSWTQAEGAEFPMDQAAFESFAAAVAAFKLGLYAAYKAHAAAIKAQTDRSAVATYDISTGWP